ncbi:DNA polymerase III subunit gamma/tau [Chloroflexota bacterium]
MAAQVFYRKWRPQTLAEVVGQKPITQTLLNALNSERVSHAYLFYGPRGTGKTSTGRILAKAVNCLADGKGEPCNSCTMCQAITEGRALDVIEIDAASNTGVDNIRDLRERVNYAPGEARYKVYIIDEVHMLSTSASNALLKTLEEPPPYAIFILATTEIHKVLPTIMSRCQRFDFRRIAQADVVSRLTHICQSEGIEIEPKALQLIAKSTTGSLRDAENLLEQLTTYYGAAIELHQAQDILGITGDSRAKDLVEHIIGNDIAAGITTVNSVHSDGLDLKQFNRELVAYLRGLLLTKTGSAEAVDLTTDDLAELKDLAAKTSLTQILRAVKLFGQLEFGFDSYSTLPLELALVDCALPAEEEKEVSASQAEHEPPKPAKKATSLAAVHPAKPAPEPAKPTSEPADISPPVAEVAASETSAEAPEITPTEPAKPTAEPADISPPAAEVAATETSAEAPEITPTEPAPTTTPTAPGSELKQMQSDWKQLVAQAPEDTKKSAAIAILRSAGVKPVAFEDDTVVLAFRYSYHMERIEKLENQRITEKVISNFLGRSCRVRCIFQPEDNHLVREVQKMGAQITNVEEK